MIKAQYKAVSKAFENEASQSWEFPHQYSVLKPLECCSLSNRQQISFEHDTPRPSKFVRLLLLLSGFLQPSCVPTEKTYAAWRLYNEAAMGSQILDSHAAR